MMNSKKGMGSVLKTELWLPLRDLLFPKHCLACGQGLYGGEVISFCQTCCLDIRIIREPYCTTCGKPFEKSAGANHLCSYCMNHPWYFDRARGIVSYQGPIVEAIKLFKYHGRMYGLETFAALIKHLRQDQLMPEPDLILPVPLHPKRLRKRGFNQALVLSRKLFPTKKKIINPFLLERHRWTQPQTGLSGAERKGNVRKAFRVKNSWKIQHKKILLVDDVFTTGATVNECARILKKNKAAEVEVFTLARVVDRQR